MSVLWRTQRESPKFLAALSIARSEFYHCRMTVGCVVYHLQSDDGQCWMMRRLVGAPRGSNLTTLPLKSDCYTSKRGNCFLAWARTLAIANCCGATNGRARRMWEVRTLSDCLSANYCFLPKVIGFNFGGLWWS